MFFNFSWKDAGFGGMNGGAVEWGNRWIFNKSKRAALHYQVGIFFLNDISKEFEQLLYEGKEVPPVSLSLGVGLSW